MAAPGLRLAKVCTIKLRRTAQSLPMNHERMLSCLRVLFHANDFSSSPSSISIEPSESVNPYDPGLLFFRSQRRRQRKVRWINRHIGFHFLYGNRLRVRMVLWPLRDREGIHHSCDRLVGSEPPHALTHRSSNELLDFFTNLDKRIGIEVVIND